jgi:hypothetical protein
VFAALLAAAVVPSPALAQTGTATWSGATGNWTDIALWTTTPNAGFYPNNGQDGRNWDAVVGGSGAVGVITLDQAIAIQKLTFSNGTITGSNSLTMNDLFTWSGGTFAGSGAVNATAGAALTAGNGGLTLTGRTLALGTAAGASTSTLTNSGGFGNVFIANGGRLENAAGSVLTVNPTGEQNVINNGGTGNAVANAGTLRKQGGQVWIIRSGVTFTNTGTVEVQAGTLRIEGGGSSTGSFAIDSGATLDFRGGVTSVFDLTGGPGVSGAGSVAFRGATVNISVPYTAASTTVETGAANFNGGPYTLTSVSLTPGPSGSGGGMLGGNASITLTNPLDWSVGSIAGSGTVTAQSGAALAPGGGGITLTGRTLTLGGTASTLGGFGNVFIGSGGRLENAAGSTLTATDSQTLINNGGSATVANAGTVVKQGGFVLTVGSLMGFTNTGTVEVQGGTFRIDSVANFTNFDATNTTLTGGTYRVLANATLDLQGRTITTLAPGTTVELNGANSNFAALDALTTINAGGTLRILGGRNFTPTGGPVSNAGALTIGQLAGDGSTLTGAVSVTGGGLLQGVGTITGAVTVDGGTLAPGTSIGALGTGATAFQNSGTYEVEIVGNANTATDQSDHLSVAGVLNFLTATPSARVRVLQLGGSFDATQTHSYTIATANSPVQVDGSTSADLNGLLDTSGFASPGFFSLSRNGNLLVLTFTPVPEPAHALLVFGAATGLIGWWRRRCTRSSSGPAMR